jgi:two-component system chemotaxis response regulator CheB
MAIRVLVVDDSALMRKLVSDILKDDPEIDVVGTAYDGKQAVDKAKTLQPDVITMDVEMPVMNGIEAVKAIMASSPTPIVMLSALTSKGAEITVTALSAGAIDFLCKPSGSISTDLRKIGEELRAKVKAAAKANIKRVSSLTSKGQPLSRRKRILIADDSDFMRKMLRDLFSHESDLEIIGEALTGKEAVELTEAHLPDVIIMDIDMPEMNGVKATLEILKHHEIPIIIFSGKTENNMKEVKLALEVGAMDFIPKPAESMSFHSIRPLLLSRVREATFEKAEKRRLKPAVSSSHQVILIGSSTGGPQTLAELIPQFPRTLEAGILIVQHMPALFTKSLADRLNKLSSVTVKEAQEGDEIVNGVALLAPGDFHMMVYEKMVDGMRKRFVSLNKEEKVHGVRPSVDVMFSSAANIFDEGMVGIILTGMGRDGAHAMGLIKAKGGYTIAQDKQTAIIFGMPDAAIKMGVIDEVLPLDRIAIHAMKHIKTMHMVEAS